LQRRPLPGVVTDPHPARSVVSSPTLRILQLTHSPISPAQGSAPDSGVLPGRDDEAEDDDIP